MQKTYDVIIAGLGAMGSAAAYHLAKTGRRVLGLDRFEPPHQLGSSHGLTRIIREAYFEHPVYVPLVQRAYQLWAALEKDAGRKLYLQTGGLMIGPANGVLVTGARRSADQHQLPHQILSAAELRRRFPVFEPGPDMLAVWEPRAGILFPELAIQSHLQLAAQHGARLQFNEPLLNWEASGAGVRVHTPAGVYDADRLLLAVGAWLTSTLPDLALPLTVERQVLFWFDPRAKIDQFQPQRCPIHIWEYAPSRFFYGFPDLGDGVKTAIHHQGEKTAPQNIRRDVADDDIEKMRALLRQFMPNAEGPLRSTAVCMYTNTPDEHFILDRHPNHPQVCIASPCSGHGFKFSSAIGEIASQMLSDQEPALDLTLFKIARFSSTRPNI